jgi:hypothetical protein
MAVPGENLIGEYLRARRQLVRPEDVGLPGPLDGRRRVPGLRRGEVALLAGLSTDYYIRLEQGRDQHPSEQVLGALARALQLDDDATAHLHRLASPPRAKRRRNHRPEKVSAGILQMLESWPQTPAAVEDRCTYVLAANALATAVSPFLAVGTNLVRAAFLDARAQSTYRDWEAITASAVAHLRAQVGPDVNDPGLTELVGELSVRCERFRQLWARHDVRPKLRGTTTVDHPQVGQLDLRYEKLLIPDTDRQMLVIYHAEPGSRSAQALALLAEMMAGDRHETLASATTTPNLASEGHLVLLR